MGTLMLMLGLLLIAAPASAGKITFKGCDATSQDNIKKAVSWLKANVKKIDKKMG